MTNEDEPRRIETRDLRLSDVPTSQQLHDATNFGNIQKAHAFALSFNGYDFLRSDAAENGNYAIFANAFNEIFGSCPQILQTLNLTGLRCLLFFEQWRTRWLDEPFISKYVLALFDEIRARL